MPRSQPAERNPAARLTWAQVRHLRRVYARGGITYTDLARMFDVSRSTATRIVLGLRWREPAQAARPLPQIEKRCKAAKLDSVCTASEGGRSG